MRKTFKQVITMIMLAILTAAPTYASCGPDICLGPCNYEELLFDTRFSGNCPEWSWTGAAGRVKVGSNWLAELSGTGSVSQTVSTGDYSEMDVAFQVYVNSTTPTTARLYVEILRGSTVLETVAIIYPQSNTTYYSMYIGNYSNDNITMRFRYQAGTNPGGTVFRVDNATMFGGF